MQETNTPEPDEDDMEMDELDEDKILEEEEEEANLLQPANGGTVKELSAAWTCQCGPQDRALVLMLVFPERIIFRKVYAGAHYSAEKRAADLGDGGPAVQRRITWLRCGQYFPAIWLRGPGQHASNQRLWKLMNEF